MNSTDGEQIQFSLEIGLIPTFYQSTVFFNEPEKGVLGLLPTQGLNEARQFTYQLMNQYGLLAESFALLSPDLIMMVGATYDQIT